MKISFENRKNFPAVIGATLSLDGVDFVTAEKRLPSGSVDRGLFSYKFQHAGFRYEIGTIPACGLISHWSGPYDAGTYSDRRIYREGIRSSLDSNDVCIVDGGYRDDSDDTLMAPTDLGVRELFKIFTRVRSQQEAVHSRFKNFKALRNVFLNSREQHRACFAAIANIVQLDLQRHPVFADGI